MWATEEGTVALVDPISGAGAMPTRNGSTGTFDGAGRINSESLLKRRIKNRACAQCGLACRQFHRFQTIACEGPEYETVVLCGANCGIDDLDVLAEFNYACDEVGLDTISTGATVALAMDLCERGIADYGFGFSDADAYRTLPRLMARREGAGRDLSEGARHLAAKWGHPELAMEVKNLELPAYDPRAAFGMGLAYATSDRGGCHMRAFPISEELLLGSMACDTFEGKAQLVIDQQNISAFTFTGIWCANWALTPEHAAQQMRFLWDREVDPEELLEVGERVWNLGRLLNLREGLEPTDDALPARIFDQSTKRGDSEKAMGREAFAEALRQYYQLRGWDDSGVPTRETLARLQVEVEI